MGSKNSKKKCAQTRFDIQTERGEASPKQISFARILVCAKSLSNKSILINIMGRTSRHTMRIIEILVHLADKIFIRMIFT